MNKKKEKAIVNAGVHEYTGAEDYTMPQDPAVQAGIKAFMGRKLGLMMHWMPGSQLSTFESWPMSDGDAAWSQSDVDWTDIDTFKKQYWTSNKSFYPYRFRPDKLAQFAKECGFKYLLFTTKHHDGFCMFDTKTTNYKVTDPSCPYHDAPNADVTRALFDAFREQGMAIHCYFSKPDWHSEYYWSPEFPSAPTRNVNYDTDEHPEIWNKYVEEVHAQLRELMNDYGDIACLWLDGGWVRPENKQDLRLEPLVEEFRQGPQPGLVVCDRTCGGVLENVVTPEKTVPEHYLPIPWETCTTLGDKFSFHYSDRFKSPEQTVALLLDIVSKGGCLALNVAPQPDGELPEGAMLTMRELGRFMRVFGDAIYDTEALAPYGVRRWRYLQKEGRYFAFWLYQGMPRLANRLHIGCPTDLDPASIREVRCFRTGDSLPFEVKGTDLVVNTEALSLRDALYAECFELVVG